MTAVVILPGLDGTATLLDAFCSALDALGVTAQAVAYPPDQALGYRELEHLVRSQLPLAGRFILLGESFSGPLAIRIAASPPPGLVGIVLSTTFASAPIPALAPLASLVRFAPARPPMALLSWSLLGRWATSTLEAELAGALRAVRPTVLRARAAAALRVDVSALVPSIAVPVLQLVASSDRLLGKSAGKALAAALPSCHTVTVAGPHLLLQTATRDCAAAIAAFALALDTRNPGTQPSRPRGEAWC